MKKLIMLLLLGVLPLSMMAQDDDMYFVPTKENKAKEAASYGMPTKTYYSGSSRTDEEYNRRAWSSVAPVDSAGNDIIEFSAVRGVYPDSAYSEPVDNDYQLTRRMSRFDDYTPSEAYWDGYRDGRWSSPWYWNSWYSWYDYDPWYWNSPWYYGRYYSWYSPWYYGYYHPWYYGYPGYYGVRWYGGGRSRSYYASQPVRRTTYSSNSRRFGESPNGNRNTNYDNTNRSFGTSSRSNSSFGNSGGSSFGGGGRSSGGGGGGGRSASGGRSFGGRR